MTDKQLLQKLKDLKAISLDEKTKQANKDILFSQISNTFIKSEKVVGGYLFNFKNVFSVMSQPLLVVAGIFVFLLSSLVLGSGLYENSKPNDSLYIARVISEKARLNTTFSQSQRDALALKFASDHAKDIATILMDPEFHTEENMAEVEKLNASFQAEISKVKTKIEKKENLNNINNPTEEDDTFVSSASSLTAGERVEIFIPETDTESSSLNSENSSSTNGSTENGVDVDSLEAQIDTSTEKLSEVQDGQKIVSEIEKLFSEGRYDEVVEKLSEVESVIKK
ncbi:MAG: hypothetical protein PHP37_03520 [Patescibacteria group bacterium]|nr:hypothetical protein [Patescibacteria group bacterium]